MDRGSLQLARALIVASGDDACSLTGENDPKSFLNRAFVTAAQGLSLDEFFDQTLPIESLVN
jgi:hypothetical protein